MTAPPKKEENASSPEVALLHKLSHVFFELQQTLGQGKPYRVQGADKEIVLYPQGLRYITRATFYGKLSINIVFDTATVILVFEDTGKIRVVEVLNR